MMISNIRAQIIFVLFFNRLRYKSCRDFFWIVKSIDKIYRLSRESKFHFLLTYCFILEIFIIACYFFDCIETRQMHYFESCFVCHRHRIRLSLLYILIIPKHLFQFAFKQSPQTSNGHHPDSATWFQSLRGIAQLDRFLASVFASGWQKYKNDKCVQLLWGRGSPLESSNIPAPQLLLFAVLSHRPHLRRITAADQPADIEAFCSLHHERIAAIDRTQAYMPLQFDEQWTSAMYSKQHASCKRFLSTLALTQTIGPILL